MQHYALRTMVQFGMKEGPDILLMTLVVPELSHYKRRLRIKDTNGKRINRKWTATNLKLKQGGGNSSCGSRAVQSGHFPDSFHFLHISQNIISQLVSVWN